MITGFIHFSFAFLSFFSIKANILSSNSFSSSTLHQKNHKFIFIQLTISFIFHLILFGKNVCLKSSKLVIKTHLIFIY